MPESTVVKELLTNIVIAALILVIGMWLAKRVKGLISNMMVKRGVDEMLASFVGSIAHILIAAFVLIAALGHLGIQTTSLVAIIGAAGLAIGLALQGSLANFASGVMIIAFRPFKVGDFIEAGGAVGVVEGIQIFSTQMRTGDNKTIIVPNSNITGGTITNYSTKDTRRVDLVFGIGYGDDIKKQKIFLMKSSTQMNAYLKIRKLLLPYPNWLIAVSTLSSDHG